MISTLSRTRVLVTGADGFIGSHLTELLLEKGYKVKALSQYNSFNNWGWLQEIPAYPGLEVVTGDIRDSHLCREIVKGVDVVFHLAALIVQYTTSSIMLPRGTLYTRIDLKYRLTMITVN